MKVTDSCFKNYRMQKPLHQDMSRPSPSPGRLNNMCNLFHHLLKEVFWHIVSGNLTTPICMTKYILGSQETYEEIVCNNPLNARHKKQKENMTLSCGVYEKKEAEKMVFDHLICRG